MVATAPPAAPTFAAPPLSRPRRSVGVHPVVSAASPAAAPLSRRSVLPLLALLPFAARAPLSAAAAAATATAADVDVPLLALVRLRDSLRDLSADVEVGTNADVRRVVRTLLRGTNLPRNLPTAARRLSAADRELALAAGRDAYEYLNQVVEYYDAMANRQQPSSKQLAFWLQCIGTAADRLDDMLALFDADDVRLAREQMLNPL